MRDFHIRGREYKDFLPKSDRDRSASEFDNMPETYERLKHTTGARKIIADWSITKVEDTNLSLANQIPELETLKVLEIGAGRGYFCRRFNETHPNTQYCVVEYEETNLDYGYKLGFFQGAYLTSIGSVYSLPFCDCQFGLVVVSEVLEHLRDLSLALSEIDRVLKPNGWVIASVPNSVLWLYPGPILISLVQSLRHPTARDKGMRLLVRRLKRLADDNNEGIYHRPFLPSQFRSLFEKRGFSIVRHMSSIIYFYYPPLSTMIDAHPNSSSMTLVSRALVKFSDCFLSGNLPIGKYLGIRQHILARKQIGPK